MRKWAKHLHLWLSVPFGLVITLICFSGAMLVFEDEASEWLYPERYYTHHSATDTPLPLSTLMGTVAAALPDSVAITGVTIPAEEGRTYQVSLSKPRRATLAVDPYTGEVKGRMERNAFFSTIFRLHRWLLGSMRPGYGGVAWGKMLTGTATLLFVFVLLSGLWIWWPRNRKALKARLKLSATKGWKRFWYDTHVVGGFYAFLLLLVMSLTALTWSFGWYRTGFYKLFGVELAQHTGGRGGGGSHGGGGGQRGPAAAPYAQWQVAYDELRRQNPTAQSIRIGDGTASVALGGYGNKLAADRYTFDPRTGDIADVSRYREQAKPDKIFGWIYSVHIGSWGGTLTRVLWFLAALLGATMPLTGYYFWIKRLARKRKKTPR